MSSRTLLKTFATLTLAVPLCLGAAACGGPKQDTKMAHVQAGDMPAGGEWTGVFYSQLYGNLHLKKEGDTISGRWRTTNGDAWGEMSGKVTGDLFRFEWTEHKIGLVGPNATHTGRGYFKYIRPGNDVDPDELHGEWGLNQSDSGNEWKAVKQKDKMPDFNEVMPDETETHGQGGGWDDGNGPPAGGGESGGGEGTEEAPE